METAAPSADSRAAEVRGASPARRGALRLLTGVWPAVAAGVALRLYRLAPQILTGDEMHTVNAARHWEVAEILQRWTYQGADYCVPLTAFFRLLMDRGVVLSELDFRLPSLLAGTALLAAAPLALRPRIGGPAATALAWLLALSPPLFFYSRIVRSYAVVVLLAGAALYAFDRWWRTRSRGAAVAYAALAGMAVYFHLGTLPVVLSPFVWAALEMLRDGVRTEAPAPVSTLGPLAALGGATLLWIGLLLLPARESLLELSALHSRGGVPTASGWLEALQLTLGTPSLLATALAVVLLARGFVVLWRTQPPLARLFAVAVVVHVAGLVALRPNYFEAPTVVSRYCLVLVPLLLAAVAVGLTAPLAPGRSSWCRLQPWGAALLVGAAFLTGPLARPELRATSFAHAASFVAFTRPAETAPLPPFYTTLDPGDGVLIEMPWLNLASRAYRTYQLAHGHEVVMGLPTPGLADPRLDYRNLVAPELDAVLASRASWLVVHMNLLEEERRIPARHAHDAAAVDPRHRFWTALRRGARRMSNLAEAAWGPPSYADDAIRAWDLEAVRERARSGARVSQSGP